MSTLLSVPRVPSIRRSCFRPPPSTSCYPFYLRRSVSGGRSHSALLVQAGRSVALPPGLVLPVVLRRSVVLPRWSVLLVQVVRSVVLPRWSVLLVQVVRSVVLPPNPVAHVVLGRSVVLPRWLVLLVQVVRSVVLSANPVVPVVLGRSFVLPRWSVLLVQVVRSVVLSANPVVPVVLGRSVVLPRWSVLLVQVVRSAVLPACFLLVVQAVLSHRLVQRPLPGWSALLGAARAGCAVGRAPSVLLVQDLWPLCSRAARWCSRWLGDRSCSRAVWSCPCRLYGLSGVPVLLSRYEWRGRSHVGSFCSLRKRRIRSSPCFLPLFLFLRRMAMARLLVVARLV